MSNIVTSLRQHPTVLLDIIQYETQSGANRQNFTVAFAESRLDADYLPYGETSTTIGLLQCLVNKTFPDYPQTSATLAPPVCQTKRLN